VRISLNDFLKQHNLEDCCKANMERYILLQDEVKTIVNLTPSRLLPDNFCENCLNKLWDLRKKYYSEEWANAENNDPFYKDTFPFCNICGEFFPLHYYAINHQ